MQAFFSQHFNTLFFNGHDNKQINKYNEVMFSQLFSFMCREQTNEERRQERLK